MTVTVLAIALGFLMAGLAVATIGVLTLAETKQRDRRYLEQRRADLEQANAERQARTLRAVR